MDMPHLWTPRTEPTDAWKTADGFPHAHRPRRRAFRAFSFFPESEKTFRQDQQALSHELGEIAFSWELCDGCCCCLLCFLPFVAELGQRRGGLRLQLLASDVRFAVVLLRLQEIVRPGVDREVLRRGEATLRDGNDVLELELERRAASPAVFSDVGAAAAHAIEDFTLHRRGDVSRVRRRSRGNHSLFRVFMSHYRTRFSRPLGARRMRFPTGKRSLAHRWHEARTSATCMRERHKITRHRREPRARPEKRVNQNRIKRKAVDHFFRRAKPIGGGLGRSPGEQPVGLRSLRASTLLHSPRCSRAATTSRRALHPHPRPRPASDTKRDAEARRR